MEELLALWSTRITTGRLKWSKAVGMQLSTVVRESIGVQMWKIAMLVKADEQFEFMATLGDSRNDNHPLVSLGLAYDGFGGSSTEKTEHTKKMIK